MSSLTANDRLSLCRFSFADGRTCRTPRLNTNANFCFYHAQLEAQAQCGASLAEDLSRILSGGYVSANELASALAHLIPAVLQGQVKPRIGRTVAYMIQTLLQTIRVAQNEYISTFGADAWRKAVAHAQHNCSVSPANTPKAASTQTPSNQSQQPNSSPANSADVGSANPPTGVQNRKAHPTAALSPASRPSHPKTQPQPPASNPSVSPAAAQPQPLPAHRQPETVAAALAVARSLFPPRPQSHAPVGQSPATA